jgi:hypothetical protein
MNPSDDAARLPVRLTYTTWVVTFLAFILMYFFMFSVVHPTADTRPCLLRLDDPLYPLVPYNRGWAFVTMTCYVVITLTAGFALLGQAYLGDHRPILRWIGGLTIQGMLRSATILLVPFCKETVSPGTQVLATMPTTTFFGFTFPWRPFATNDLLFSGHVGEFLLLMRVTRSWPPAVRAFLWGYQILQVYGLLATRTHYTVDMIVAIPCAFFADRMAVAMLTAMARVPRVSTRAGAFRKV